MKLIVKIIILCLIIFSAGIYITKMTIDQTFEKVQCSQIENSTPVKILHKTIEV